MNADCFRKTRLRQAAPHLNYTKSTCEIQWSLFNVSLNAGSAAMRKAIKSEVQDAKNHNQKHLG